jgi:hypothetical protein
MSEKPAAMVERWREKRSSSEDMILDLRAQHRLVLLALDHHQNKSSMPLPSTKKWSRITDMSIMVTNWHLLLSLRQSAPYLHLLPPHLGKRRNGSRSAVVERGTAELMTRTSLLIGTSQALHLRFATDETRSSIANLTTVLRLQSEGRLLLRSDGVIQGMHGISKRKQNTTISEL